MVWGFVKFFGTTIVVGLANSPAYAGAWNQRAGEGQVITTSAWSQAKKIYDGDFDAAPLTEFTKIETRLYIEHGATGWLTLVGNAGLQTLTFRDEDSRFDFEGLDDVELGGQVEIYSRSGISASIRGSYIIDSKLDNRAVDVLRGGDQFEIRGLLGQSEQTILGEFFYDAQLALRTESFESVDAVQGALTLGYKPTERWLVMSQSYANFSNNDMSEGFAVPEQFQLNTQFSVAKQYRPGRYIQAGVGQTVLGQNVVKERSFFIGMWTAY